MYAEERQRPAKADGKSWHLLAVTPWSEATSENGVTFAVPIAASISMHRVVER
jgi:hypothetical protein